MYTCILEASGKNNLCIFKNVFCEGSWLYFACLPAHLPAYMCLCPQVPADHKGAQDPMELELEMVVSHHVSAATNLTGVLCKSTQCS